MPLWQNKHTKYELRRRTAQRDETGDRRRGPAIYCMSAICQEFGSGGRRDEVNATERQGKCQSTSQRGAKAGGGGGEGIEESDVKRLFLFLRTPTLHSLPYPPPPHTTLHVQIFKICLGLDLGRQGNIKVSSSTCVAVITERQQQR